MKRQLATNTTTHQSARDESEIEEKRQILCRIFHNAPLPLFRFYCASLVATGAFSTHQLPHRHCTNFNDIVVLVMQLKVNQSCLFRLLKNVFATIYSIASLAHTDIAIWNVNVWIIFTAAAAVPAASQKRFCESKNNDKEEDFQFSRAKIENCEYNMCSPLSTSVCADTEMKSDTAPHALHYVQSKQHGFKFRSENSIIMILNRRRPIHNCELQQGICRPTAKWHSTDTIDDCSLFCTRIQRNRLKNLHLPINMPCRWCVLLLSSLFVLPF